VDRGEVTPSAAQYSQEDNIEELEPESPTMSDSELINEVNNQLSRGTGGSEDDSEVEISLPLDYYYSRLPGLTEARAKDLNASRYVSNDVAIAIDSTIAELSELFTVSEIVLFTPNGERDEDQSLSETQLLNRLFFDEYNGYEILQRALKDCLLHRNCTAKVYWDEKEEVTYEEYENINPLAMQQLVQPKIPNEQVEIIEQEMISSTVVESGAPQQAQSDSMMSIKIKRTNITGRPRIDILKPENVTVSSNHDSPTLLDAKFIAHENILYKSELKESGYDKEIVDSLPEYSQSTETYSRARRTDDYDYYSSDVDTLVRIHECYITIDYDGDGIAELRKIVIADNILLSNEPVDSKPLVGGVTKMSPHNYTGISLYDDIKTIQDSKTEVLRSIVDGTKLSSNPRIGVVNGAANMDDIITSRTGGIVRMENPNGIINIPNPEIPQSSYQFLEIMDGIRRDRGGSAIDSTQQAQSIGGRSASGISMIMGTLEQQNLVLARTFAETFIRGLFQELHNVLRAYHPGQINAKVGDTWITQTPSNWKKRTSLIVTLGGSRTQRNTRLNMLREVLVAQEKLHTSGSAIFSEQKLYNTLSKMAKLSLIDNPTELFSDPSSPEGIKAQQFNAQKKQKIEQENNEARKAIQQSQQAIAQAEVMKGQAALQSQQAKLQISQMQSQIDMLEAKLKTSDNDKELAYKYEKLKTDTTLKLTELENQNNKELDKQFQENKETVVK